MVTYLFAKRYVIVREYGVILSYFMNEGGHTQRGRTDKCYVFSGV